MSPSLRAVLALLAAAAPVSAQPPDYGARFRALAAQPGLADAERLKRVVALDWEYRNVEHPELATSTGYPGQNARWTDRSPAGFRRRAAVLRDRAAAVRAVREAGLAEGDRLTRAVLLRELDEAVEGLRFPDDLMPVTQREGPQYLADLLDRMPAATARDYADILARLEGLPTVVAQTTALLDSGLALGVTPPRVTLRDVPAQVAGLVPEDALRSPLLAPFTRIPPAVPADEAERLRARAVEAYAQRVRPAYLRFRDYLAGTYVPRAKESLAARDLPDGAAWYAYNVKVQTTTTRTPGEIHRLGLSEVARLRTAMDSVIRAVGFRGDFAAFTQMLRTDPRFYLPDSASLVRAYRDVAKRIDPELPKLFGVLPRLPYGVGTIPSYAAPSQTTAYYMRGSPEARRAGMYVVNTYRPEMRPTWEMEALTIHEAVPGHHLQIALAQELDLPAFRRYGGYTAFVEGWALYSESLGPALGLYRDPYSRFGQLTYEMWRAIRLVLDPAIHTMGWTREQAIAYFRANSAKTEQDIAQEVDRYIAWPGQALAYKSGELAITALRRHAERELGERFDVRAFHDALLGQGALPLDVLEPRMRAWVAARRADGRVVP
jgi:uncharacterized protein (DUF885 family)